MWRQRLVVTPYPYPSPVSLASCANASNVMHYQIWSGLRGGATALYTAAHRGHAVIVELLLANGADPSTPDKLGATPLHKVCLCLCVVHYL